MREAPALVLIDSLVKAGATVTAYDPVSVEEAKRRITNPVSYCKDKYEATLDADALLLVTEWTEFRMPTWPVVKKTMRTPLVIDGRNIYDKKELTEYGIEYLCIGRK